MSALAPAIALSVIEGRDPVTGDLLRVEVRDGIITAIDHLDVFGTAEPFVAPGLVDLQVNGFAGFDVNAEDVDVDTLAGITEALAEVGVTTWVPTVITAAEDRIVHALRTIADARAADPRLARAMPFAHVEGPFISMLDGPRGAHDPAQVRPVDPEEVSRWRAAGPVGYVTLSPHGPVAGQVAAIIAAGCAVAVGHTHATPGEVRAAVHAGASLSTHLGNGTFAELPRHPNHVWTQLADDRLSCGFIADGHHLDADTLSVMLRATGPRAFLVSDSVALAGSPPGRYDTPVGGSVTLEGGRLTHDASGLLAGAAASLADGLRFVIRSIGLPIDEALALTTSRPGAIVQRITHRRGHPGRLAVGAPADLLLLDDTGRVLEVHRA